MQLIIISPPAEYPHEPRMVHRILQQSAVTLHLRKPGCETRALAAYLARIPTDLHGRIMVHGHPGLLDRFGLRGIHFTQRQRNANPQAIRQIRRAWPAVRISSAFHRLADIPTAGPFDYVFLSPIFDSISKPGYRAAFTHVELRRFLTATGQRVVALGGIDAQHIDAAADLGFDDVAVLGAVWSGDNPVKAALDLAAACKRITS